MNIVQFEVREKGRREIGGVFLSANPNLLGEKDVQ